MNRHTLITIFLCAVCADNNHVRTWTVTRFRGMISTQPGSTPLTSFKILSLDDIDGHGGCSAGTEIGKMKKAKQVSVYCRMKDDRTHLDFTDGPGDKTR